MAHSPREAEVEDCHDPIDQDEQRFPLEQEKKDVRGYHTECRIGAGSFGVVYLAKDTYTGIPYAIKHCYKHKAEKVGTSHHVMRERRVLSRLDHQFIIKLYEAFQDRFTIYLVIEYAPNGNLLEKFQEYGVFRNDVIRFYTAEIIMALEYLRKQKIVHRNLIMENVLLDKDFHIKISDFGLSVVLEAHYEEASLKNVINFPWKTNSEVIGTAGYYAPEVIDKGPVSFGTDLWCLGCMMYEFHTGMMAFDEGQNNWTYVRAGRHRRFPDGSDPAIVDLVSKLLIPDPGERIGVDDLVWLKNHQFYGTDDPGDWDLLHTLPPPPFDPADEADLDLVFGASDEDKCYLGASQPEIYPPPEVIDWDDTGTPVVTTPPPGPIGAPETGKCNKCCFAKNSSPTDINLKRLHRNQKGSSAVL